MRSHAKALSAGSTEHRASLLLCTAISFCLLGALVASPAYATKAPLGSFGDQIGEPAGHVGFGTGVAVNRAGAGGADPGDVYVSDWQNGRVDQFAANGTFVRAFGWDVVAKGENDTGADEQQTVTVPASVTGGTFQLTATTGTGTGVLTAGSNVIQNVEGAQGSFHVGDTIAATGLLDGTTITAVGPGTLTLSENAGAGSAFAVVLTARETTVPIQWDAPATGAGSLAEALEALPGIGAGNVTVIGGPGATSPFEVAFSGGDLSADDIAQMTPATPNALTGGEATVATPVNGGGYEICEADSAPQDSCKSGVRSALAGSLNNPEGIAVDQATGNVFLASNTNKRIDVLGATGEYQASFGVGVDTGGPALELCTAASTCQAGANTATAGGFSNLIQAGIAVDPSTGNLYVGDRNNRRVNEFSFTLDGSDEVTAVSFVRAFGWKVNATAPAEELQTCTTATGCLTGTAGGGNGQFPTSTPNSIAVDSGGFLYIVSSNANCSASNPCRVQKFNPDASFKENFGPSSGGAGACQLTWTSGDSRGQGPGGVTVDTSSQHVFVTRKVSATGTGGQSAATFEICEFDSDGVLLDRHPSVALATNNSGYLQPALGTGERLYVNAPIANQRGATYMLGTVPAPGAQILPVTGVGQTVATFNGEVIVPSPGGPGFAPSYQFEYSADGGATWDKAPVPAATAPSTTPGPVAVSTTVSGLQANLAYRVRLTATTSFSATSAETTFKTGAAAPTITYPEVVGPAVTDTTAELKGSVNPNNSGTTYRFEWGTTGSYGNASPDFDPFIGAGGQPQGVTVKLSGLQPDTLYHYRLVAVNASGTTAGGDRKFRTFAARQALNAAGLPDSRGYELVSPPDKRPQGAVRTLFSNTNIFFQPAIDGDSVVFPLLGGTPDSEAGGDLTYLAERTAGGWESSMVSPRSIVPNPSFGTAGAGAGYVTYYSPDLSCGIVETFNPLTEDTPAVDVELGVSNLYRRNDDGTHTLITDIVPANPGADDISIEAVNVHARVIGASSDCSKVYFKSVYRYLPSPSGLYEWDEGTLRDAGRLPDGGLSSEAVPGGAEIFNGEGTLMNSVSADGSRLFFGARSNEPATADKWAVFVREEGEPTVEVSRRQGGANDSLGSRYELASPDGSHVFFLASYGLTPSSSSGPLENCAQTEIINTAACDLYDYDVDTGQLTNLSATSDPANTNGAVVAGVIDVSRDGSSVYFAARGQLVPGKGKTYAQNTSGAGSANVYLAREGQLTYVATISTSDYNPNNESTPLVRASDISSFKYPRRAEATPDGDHLVFLSRSNLTGYDSGGVYEAYRYSAETGTLLCVSCRSDGLPSVGTPPNEPSPTTHPLIATFDANTFKNQSRRRVMSDDGSRVFFSMPDALAPGAVEGQANLYEWHEGQIYLLTTGADEFVAIFEATRSTIFVGASASGDDVFIRTKEQLTPHDTDFVLDIYDVRVGGGFAPPPPPEIPCDPAADQCQGAPVPQPGAPAPASAGFSGPGNPPPPAQKKASKKKKAKKAKKKQRKRRGAKADKRKNRTAKTNRGGAK